VANVRNVVRETDGVGEKKLTHGGAHCAPLRPVFSAPISPKGLDALGDRGDMICSAQPADAGRSFRVGTERHGRVGVKVRTIGTARRIDQLGRVVVPAELRRVLGIRQGDLLDIRVEDGHLVLLKIEPECAICGRVDNLVELHEKHVCKDCIREISLV
jgi:AbrB family transcriptional regulator, transcriptional pleiotropic regulator of transition state genes